MDKEAIVEALHAYREKFVDENDKVARFITYLKNAKTFLGKTNSQGHITSSSWVVNKNKTKVLLTNHKKLDRWLQLGGHTEEGESLYESACREVAEESGIDRFLTVSKAIYDLDIHWIPKFKNTHGHYHYDVRYLFEADENLQITVSDESHDVKWVEVAHINAYTSSDSILRMVNKMKCYKK